MEEPDKLVENWRNPDGTLKPGHPNLGAGRPKGKTMKEYAREYFALKTDEEKKAYIDWLDDKKPGFAWTMGEGLPQQDITSKGEAIMPTPILGGITSDVPTDTSGKEDS